MQAYLPAPGGRVAWQALGELVPPARYSGLPKVRRQHRRRRRHQSRMRTP